MEAGCWGGGGGWLTSQSTWQGEEVKDEGEGVGRGVCHHCAPPWAFMFLDLPALDSESVPGVYPVASQAWASGSPYCSQGWEGFLGSSLRQQASCISA